MHLFLGHCGLILQLARYNIIESTLGPTAPERWGAAGGKPWGTMDLIEVYWPALTRIGYPSKLGSYWGRKFRGHKLGLVFRLSLRKSGYKRIKF